MDLNLDVYEPVQKENSDIVVPEIKPALIIIHGGAYAHGNKSMSTYIVDLAKYFASRGFVSFSLDYRVSSHKGNLPDFYPYRLHFTKFERSYPAIRDAKAAVRFIKANAEEFGISPDNIAVDGGSAGSEIAVTVGIVKEEDYKNEISIEDDETLKTTNMD